MKKILLPLLFLTFSYSQSLNAEIYKWTDKEGKTHYSSTPPKDDPSKATAIGDKIKSNIGKVQPATTAYTSTDSEEEEKETDKKSTDTRDGPSAEKIKYCDNLKSNIKTIQDHNRVNIIVDGEPSAPLSEEEKNNRLVEYQSNLEKNCKDI